jgi:hypothetical protein
MRITSKYKPCVETNVSHVNAKRTVFSPFFRLLREQSIGFRIAGFITPDNPVTAAKFSWRLANLSRFMKTLKNTVDVGGRRLLLTASLSKFEAIFGSVMRPLFAIRGVLFCFVETRAAEQDTPSITPVE